MSQSFWGGDVLRKGLVFFCLAVYAVRVTLTLLVFLKRKFVWAEAAFVSLFMAFVLLAFAWGGGGNSQPVGPLEGAALGLYFYGSYLNTWSEYQRRRFKSNAANEGRLFTQGLFRLSRNINYFGDVVLFSGLALVTGVWAMLAIPLLMALNFVFFIIPQKETYLSQKYGAPFDDYARHTKTLIPFVY
ncbi:MAG: DUF1295 domain-containing protein [Rhodospirillales bacterium]|nr:DUF1295 domain-containing protein [Rhodospirillales bacterium]